MHVSNIHVNVYILQSFGCQIVIKIFYILLIILVCFHLTRHNEFKVNLILRQPLFNLDFTRKMHKKIEKNVPLNYSNG